MKKIIVLSIAISILCTCAIQQKGQNEVSSVADYMSALQDKNLGDTLEPTDGYFDIYIVSVEDLLKTSASMEFLPSFRLNMENKNIKNEAMNITIPVTTKRTVNLYKSSHRKLSSFVFVSAKELSGTVYDVVIALGDHKYDGIIEVRRTVLPSGFYNFTYPRGPLLVQ